jgi:serine/threonine-protein kinase
MKNILRNRLVRKLLYILGTIIIFILILDNLIMPWYVSSPQISVPDVVGMEDKEAINSLEQQGFTPVIGDTSYGLKFKKGVIFFQRPLAGDTVKEGRRIYLFVSGGEKVVSVPILRGKSIVDAKFALERIGLKLGRVERVASSHPEDMIFDQQFEAGTPLKQGAYVSITVSAGRGSGVITVPDLIGKSLNDAQAIIKLLNLKVGKINYQASSTLLPNTILDQYPTVGNKLNPGDNIDLFVTTPNPTPIPESEED